MSDTTTKVETPDETRELAEWFARELERAAKAHGSAWPKHEAWVRSYLAEEMREKLRGRHRG
jgi:hypothetical protein